MLIFSIQELMDEELAYEFLRKHLWPNGLHCPKGHPLPPDQAPHMVDRFPVLEYRCRICGKVFHIFTGTALSGIRYSCVHIVLMLRGFAQGTSSKHLAEELKMDRGNLLEWRHYLQALLEKRFSLCRLSDKEIETDELYQNSGEKGVPHLDPADPPRKRANKVRGHGTWDSDRPPVFGAVGRTTGEVWLDVEHSNDGATCLDFIERASESKVHMYTDEWQGYNLIPRETERTRTAINHSGPKCLYALDLDGDGIREAHINTMEGIWTGLRNFLRPFRGVNKVYLSQYVRVFAWTHNIKRITSEFLQAMVLNDFILKPT